MTPTNKRFERCIKKFGMKIVKVAFRPDLLSVQYMNRHLFTIPKRMYAFPIEGHSAMDGLQHPDYFDREQKALAWNFKVKRTNFLDDDWQEERIHNQKFANDWV